MLQAFIQGVRGGTEVSKVTGAKFHDTKDKILSAQAVHLRKHPRAFTAGYQIATIGKLVSRAFSPFKK